MKLLIATLCLALVSGCTRKLDEARYPNATGDATLIVELFSYGGGGAFGQQALSVSLASGGAQANQVRELSHASGLDVVWLDGRRVRLCFNGEIEEGGSRWTGNVGGGDFEIVLDNTCGRPER